MTDAHERARGLGDFLVESHDWLRKELAHLRKQVDALVEDDSAGPFHRLSGDLAQQMRQHCLEFCGALEEHHTGEDRGAFPMLAYQYPEIESELTRLGEEHKTVAKLQKKIERLVQDYVPGQTDPARLRAELERLSTDLEAHFEYEEKTVVDLLNAMGPAPDIP